MERHSEGRVPDALVFDLYGTLVDPISISGRLAASLPGADAVAVARTWRQKQIEYSFRLTVMDRYEDFAWVTERSLRYALAVHGHQAPDADGPVDVGALLAEYDRLAPFPDVAPGMARLARSGHVLHVLSNGSTAMVRNCLANSGLEARLDGWTSVDSVRRYKPHPAVYRHAAEKLGRPVGELRLVSSNPFDVVGARAAGLSAAWLNRGGEVFDTLDEAPDLVVTSLDELAKVLTADRGER
jgi:2-haloacid dehalogenase